LAKTLSVSSNEETLNSIQKSSNRTVLVGGLIEITTSILNSVWPNHSFSSKTKLLPIRNFIEEILRRSRTSFSTLQLALLYLLRIKKQLPAYLQKIAETAKLIEQPKFCDSTPAGSLIPSKSEKIDLDPSDSTSLMVNGRNHPFLCGRRMFLSALIVAGKYLQDQTFSNRAWAKISGLEASEITRSELEFLKIIDYRLHVNSNTFESWSRILMNWTNFNKFSQSASKPSAIAKQNSQVVALKNDSDAVELHPVKRRRGSTTAHGIPSPANSPDSSLDKIELSIQLSPILPPIKESFTFSGSLSQPFDPSILKSQNCRKRKYGYEKEVKAEFELDAKRQYDISAWIDGTIAAGNGL